MSQHRSTTLTFTKRDIATVTGAVSVELLAPILYHEHVILDMRKILSVNDLWLTDVDVMIKELSAYKQRGGRTVISLTNGSMGRDLAKLRAISRGSGINILAATGQYTRLVGPPVADVGLLADRFVKEIEVGIDDTTVRAAVIGEIATSSHPISDYERQSFAAAARAHLATNAPIATHTHNGLYARWQLRHLMSLGVQPDRIVIGHMDASSKRGMLDVDAMVCVAAEGAFVGIDMIGLANFYSEPLRRYMPSDEDRADAVSRLVDKGWSDNIIISHDICRRKHLKINGGCGYAHIQDVFLPMLEARGISRGVSRKFLNDNPLRWLTGAAT